MYYSVLLCTINVNMMLSLYPYKYCLKKEEKKLINASKKKLTMIFGIALIMSIALSSNAYAIKYGQPDEDAHPYVCWIVTWDGASNYVYLGTGSLLNETVVLTAGHITNDSGGQPIFQAWVSFSPTASWPPWGDGDWIDVASWYTHPDYNLGGGKKGLTDWITHDVGILILTEEVELDEYAELPSAGLVDTLRMKEDVDIVGYGVQIQVLYYDGPPYGPPSWDWIDFGYRYNSTSQLIASKHIMSDEFLRLTANPAKGKGGTTFGDSGGPILLAGTNTVLGVCSWGTNYNCAGIGYQQRVDTTDILDWLTTEFPTE